MSEVILASFNRDSATSGIQEAIDALGERGGSVRIPTGKWRLRQSMDPYKNGNGLSEQMMPVPEDGFVFSAPCEFPTGSSFSKEKHK